MTGRAQDGLRDLSAHFAFGDNWADYASLIDAARIDEAKQGLGRLFGDGALSGASFLDIGCGSGLHALAAARLGAARIVAVDIDPASVATTRAVLGAHAPGLAGDIRAISVFDLEKADVGGFDAVYSWGVLHHTGDMRAALAAAARSVTPGGLFAFALYRRTPLCGFWRLEKRWYAQASPRAQAAARAVYVGFFRAAFAVTGRSFKSYVANYFSRRGMDYWHDVHDWLGGYPYESIASQDVERCMQALGFDCVRSFTRKPSFGLFGTGCDEYVYRRKA